MKNRRAGWVLLLVLILAGCGAGGDDDSAAVEPTVTPAPTLAPEERTTFDSGTAENPLQLVISPVDIVADRLNEILAVEFRVGLNRLRPNAELSTLGLDDLTDLNPALRRDFDVELPPDAGESLDTLTDLVAAVQALIAGQVADALLARSGLHFELVLTDAHADALAALCASGGGLVALPWLDGVTYTAAVAQNCGQPLLRIARRNVALAGPDEYFTPLSAVPPATAVPAVEADAEAESTPEADDAAQELAEDTSTETEPTTLTAALLSFGAAGVIVADASLGTSDLGLVSGRTFCRVDLRDFYSWLLPSLVLQTRGLDLDRAAANVVDYADSAALLRAVGRGDCAAAGLPREAYDALAPVEGARVIFETVAMPYGILMTPLEVGLGVRLSLVEHLPALAADAQDGRALYLLLGQAALLPVEPGDLADLDAFMQSTGLDFAQLGD